MARRAAIDSRCSAALATPVHNHTFLISANG